MRTHHSTRWRRQFGTQERSLTAARPAPPDARSGCRRGPAPAPGCAPTASSPASPRRGGRPRPRGSRPSTRSGRTWLAEVALDDLVPAGEDGLHRRRRGGHAEALEEPGHGRRRPASGPRRAARSRLTRAPASRPGRRGPPRCPRAAATPWSGSTGPAGSSATSARLRTGSSSENTSSSRSVGATGVRARTSSWIPSRRARARQRCSPCDAWVRASRPSSTITRSSRCGPTVLTPRRRSSVRDGRQRVEQVAVPAALVVLLDRSASPGRRRPAGP